MPEFTNKDPTSVPPDSKQTTDTTTSTSTTSRTTNTSTPPFPYNTLGLVIWQLEPAYRTHPIPPLILTKFSLLHTCLNEFLGHSWPMRTFAVTNKPGMLITIGPWESPAQHYEEFERSETILEVLAALGGFADVKGSWHVGVGWEEVRGVWERSGRFVMGRWWMEDGEEGKGAFESEGWKACKERWEGGGEKVIAGWRVPGWGWELGPIGEERVDGDGDGGSGDGDGDGDGEEGSAGRAEWWSLGTLSGDATASTAAGQVPDDWDEVKNARGMCRKSELWQLEMLDVKPLDDSTEDDEDDEDEDEDDEKEPYDTI